MFKNIVVCLDDTGARDETIRAATTFACQHGASLLGVYAPLGEDSPLVPAMGVVSADLITMAMKQYKERRASCKASFEQITQEAKCGANWLQDDSITAPIRAAAYADLVICSQAAKNKQLGINNMNLINRLILDSGKPVLLIPKGWNQASFGTRIALGWDESREAVRAVSDAMPMLREAEQVDVVTINYAGDDDILDVSEISTFLSARGVNNHYHSSDTSQRSDTPEKVLTEYCTEHKCDLLVVGAYGHTRLREIVLGGVTRAMIKHGKIPVLLSH